jgi:cytosine/adenosine deaminase-related metal-dependent hydrolase
MKQFKMKKTLVAASMIGISTLLAACGQAEKVDSTTQAEAGTLYVSSTMITMNDEQPRAEAVFADENGTIEFVGNRDKAKQLYPNVEVVDLGERVVMPALLSSTYTRS